MSRDFSRSPALSHQEDEKGVSRYTLAYPELPSELSALVEGDSSIEVPDYSSVSLDDLDDELDSKSKTKNNASTYVPGYAEQGGYDAELDWDPQRSVRAHDARFTKNAFFRRALVGGAKGATVGIIGGGLISLFCLRFMSFTHKVPIVFHVYTVGGGAFLCGGMNSVHQARRYKEYIGFKQSGMANPEEVGLKDARNQMADWMASAYSPEYVEQWKQSDQAEESMRNQMTGLRV